jgi:hypothetical protein
VAPSILLRPFFREKTVTFDAQLCAESRKRWFLSAFLFMLEFHYPTVGQAPRADLEPSSEYRRKVLQSVDCYQVVL